VAERILVVVGTRPEAIKLAPIILRLHAEPESFETVVCATGQHREMLDSVLRTFAIVPDIDLDLMRPEQTSSAVAAGVLRRLDDVLVEVSPDRVLVQGDTTTVMAASLAAFHRSIPVGHVEAGLRTGDLRSPFPEEMNRRLTDLVADLHFAPTLRSAEALRTEGVSPRSIHLTGNPVVDALLAMTSRSREVTAGDLVLLTAHRRENLGEPLRRVLRAIRRLAFRFPDFRFVYPTHPNPNVQREIGLLRGVSNVEMAPPADYQQLVDWLRSCRLVISDSGGIQEEAPCFGKPILVLRDSTERPEGVEAGIAILVGTDEDRIFFEAERLLTDDAACAEMARTPNPYGDGKAAERIVSILAGRPYAPFGQGLESLRTCTLQSTPGTGAIGVPRGPEP
jgi:UDP-N-acetylglucosamine 2-epimerase